MKMFKQNQNCCNCIVQAVLLTTTFRRSTGLQLPDFCRHLPHPLSTLSTRTILRTESTPPEPECRIPVPTLPDHRRCIPRPRFVKINYIFVVSDYPKVSKQSKDIFFIAKKVLLKDNKIR